MSNQKLGILAVVAAVMVMWAVVQSRVSRRKGAEPSHATYLIQGLDTADVQKISVGGGDDAVQIERQDGRFVVVNKARYPADTKQINDLITKVLDVRTTEFYTDDPKNHEDLEVTEDKARHVVKFFKSDGSLLTGVVVGKSRETGQGSYVRQASSDKVYLAESAPWFQSTALSYVDQDIASVKREDVNAVTVTTPEGTYTLRPEQDGDDAVMENLPPGRKLKDSDARSVFSALTSLRFDDVNKPADIEGLRFDYRYVCRMDDSTEYRLELAKKGDKTYLKCGAEYTNPAKVTINPGQVDSPEELKKKETTLLAQEHAQKFMLRHKDWIYEVSDWKAKSLTKTRSELLEDIAKEAEEKAEGPEKGQGPSQENSPSPTAEQERPEGPESAVEPNAAGAEN